MDDKHYARRDPDEAVPGHASRDIGPGADILHDADIHYGVSDPGGIERSGPGIALSIFADRPHLRDALREDAEAAGLRVRAGSLGELLSPMESALGDVVLVDCPVAGVETLAGLARLDLRAFLGGTRLIVSTGVEALDDVFACMDHSDPVLLVNPSRAERVVALGQVLATLPQGRVRELSDDDRLMILRLTEQVGEIAGRMDRLAPVASGRGDGREAAGTPAGSAVDRAGNAAESAGGRRGEGTAGKPAARAPLRLPEARLLRRILRQRQLRARFIAGDLFADPAWDMLLDLAAARGEGKQVSVTSLCIAAAVPPTTALRWIGQMVESGLFRRVLDDNDRRRAFIELTDKAVEALGRYFEEIGLDAPVPV